MLSQSKINFFFINNIYLIQTQSLYSLFINYQPNLSYEQFYSLLGSENSSECISKNSVRLDQVQKPTATPSSISESRTTSTMCPEDISVLQQYKTTNTCKKW